MANENTAEQENKNPWLAVLLSKMFPGAGQIYAGAKARGFFFYCANHRTVADHGVCYLRLSAHGGRSGLADILFCGGDGFHRHACPEHLCSL